jgi:hypothetical protein
MGVLRILSPSGDTKVEWDLDVEETVREAERIFRENAAKGYAAFRLDDGLGAARHVDAWDPTASLIVQTPRILGG